VPYLNRARVAIVPLRVGSGTRLKALEALAAGRPVVGTTVGLAGLPVRNGLSALVADDSAAFAKAVVTAITDDSIASSLASNGGVVAQQFGWARLGSDFSDALLSLVG
jgi:glycosyltransferase involved in cell wall biosynthesis